MGMTTKPLDKVVVHPLVLLSVVDHFNRIGKVGSSRRVVGVLLGQWKTIEGEKLLDISNSFAVPFDEDSKNPNVWYLDHDYLENMAGMFKKVNAKERIVGWYHTGPKLYSNDINIHDLIKRYNPNAVLVVIDAKPKELGLPTEAYVSVEVVHDDGTLSQRITDQVQGLRGLIKQLESIGNYLRKVYKGELPMNHSIMYLCQDIFNLLPDVNLAEFSRSFHLKTNDQLMVVYLSSLIRTVISLHNLINNKISTRQVISNKYLI